MDKRLDKEIRSQICCHDGLSSCPAHWAPLSADWRILAYVKTPELNSQGQHQPLLADASEEVFVTTRILCVKKNPRFVAHSNVILANEVGHIFLDVHPIYPFDTSEIPLTHLKATQCDPLYLLDSPNLSSVCAQDPKCCDRWYGNYGIK